MTRQQVVMDLLFGQVRRGTPVVPDQALHGEQIPLPGHRHHARQFHIGEKLAFQGADGRHIGEGRDGTLRGGTALTHGSLLKTRGLEEDARPNAKQQPRSIEPRPVHGKPSWRKGPSHRGTTNAPKAPTAQPFSAIRCTIPNLFLSACNDRAYENDIFAEMAAERLLSCSAVVGASSQKGGHILDMSRLLWRCRRTPGVDRIAGTDPADVVQSDTSAARSCPPIRRHTSGILRPAGRGREDQRHVRPCVILAELLCLDAICRLHLRLIHGTRSVVTLSWLP